MVVGSDDDQRLFCLVVVEVAVVVVTATVVCLGCDSSSDDGNGGCRFVCDGDGSSNGEGVVRSTVHCVVVTVTAAVMMVVASGSRCSCGYDKVHQVLFRYAGGGDQDDAGGLGVVMDGGGGIEGGPDRSTCLLR